MKPEDRIIPARAGFTSRSGRSRPPHQDHPRSRGVYAGASAPSCWRPGSSPLARGLHDANVALTDNVGIIPARAGFTTALATMRTTPSDHPRSRGVYHNPVCEAYSTGGSSPLARGLPALCGECAAYIGIIPARAGFTATASALGGRAEDHPRSRGVYPFMMVTAASTGGSSPLARGLQRALHHLAGDGRIIPARAGFTRGSGAVGASGSGSSPLARGLHAPGPGDRRPVGIIPARAGFTDPRVARRGRPGDHPRSRGVYAGHDAAPSPHRGSSPLARGLLVLPHVEIGTRDHPRSRGVYPASTITATSTMGSSPLARGLLPHLRHPRPGRRIIPARAGFTAGRPPARSRPGDHPRSRGVYEMWGPDKPAVLGSSPLARGLRARSCTASRAMRIIPARAGFTMGPFLTAMTAADHPRSRGVYR